MAGRVDRRFEQQAQREMEMFDASARKAEARRRAVLRSTEQWLSARVCGDERSVAAIEQADPALARRLRAFEGELAHLGEAARGGALGRLRDAVLALRMTDVLHELVEEECPLCAAEGIHH